MPYATIHRQRIHFEDSGGSGPPVVLGHGFFMDQSMFDRNVEALAPAYRVIRWDARCFGETQEDGRPFTYWDSAADCVGLLDHLGIEHAVIGGNSQGGFISMRAALSYPKRVTALILVSTQAGVDDEAELARSRQMFEDWATLPSIDHLLESVASVLLGARAHWEPWVSRLRAMPRERLREAGRCLLERDDITARLGEIGCPAIVFRGDADLALTPERAEALARGLSGCVGLVSVKGAHHALNLTHFDEFNPALLAFLLAHA